MEPLLPTLPLPTLVLPTLPLPTLASAPHCTLTAEEESEEAPTQGTTHTATVPAAHARTCRARRAPHASLRSPPATRDLAEGQA